MVLGSIQLLSGFGFSSSTFNQSYHDHPVVTVRNGTLIGIRDTRYDQDLFLGIPYAQPPVGNLRLNRLQPLNEKWHERSAKSYGPWCYSIPESFPGFNQNGFAHDESEDCLTLNVVRPVVVASITGLPVLHGYMAVASKRAEVRIRDTTCHLSCRSLSKWASPSLQRASTTGSGDSVFSLALLSTSLGQPILAFTTKGWRCTGFKRTLPHVVEMPRV